jgi:hypothetical protein
MEAEEQENLKLQATQLILKYLAHFGYSDTLGTLKKSLNLPYDQKETEDIQARIRIVEYLKNGKIEDSLNLIKKAFPNIEKHPDWKDVLFQIQCLQFIELIRERKDKEALAFAGELGTYGFEGSKYMDTLQDVIALIAYQNPETSPVGNLMTQQHREEVAKLVNSTILVSLGMPSTTELEQLLRQLTLVQSLLDKEKRWTVNKFVQDPIALKRISESQQETAEIDTVVPDWMQQ